MKEQISISAVYFLPSFLILCLGALLAFESQRTFPKFHLETIRNRVLWINVYYFTYHIHILETTEWRHASLLQPNSCCKSRVISS